MTPNDAAFWLVEAGIATGVLVDVLCIRDGESQWFAAAAGIVSAFVWPMALLILIVGKLLDCQE